MQNQLGVPYAVYVYLVLFCSAVDKPYDVPDGTEHSTPCRKQ